MKNIKFISIVIGVVVIAFLSTRFLGNNDNDIVTDNNFSTSLDAKSSDEGNVEVTVVPIIESDLSFKITLSTHSVDIIEDLTKVSTLVDENGNNYSPTEWNGTPVGGHHREGILVFEKITPQPKSITLIINSIGGVERKFDWVL